uniref:Uncharacterized protein n=1 Tax=Arundo donax TaxID=35708 RepID=A0A0A9EWN4_ARUDO
MPDRRPPRPRRRRRRCRSLDCSPRRCGAAAREGSSPTSRWRPRGERG